MSFTRIRAPRPPPVATPQPIPDESILEGYLEDASGSAPGRATGLLRPSDGAEIAAFLAATAGRGITILPQAARSSLTAGAIPNGDVVVSVEAMSEMVGSAAGLREGADELHALSHRFRTGAAADGEGA